MQQKLWDDCNTLESFVCIDSGGGSEMSGSCVGLLPSAPRRTSSYEAGRVRRASCCDTGCARGASCCEASPEEELSTKSCIESCFIMHKKIVRKTRYIF